MAARAKMSREERAKQFMPFAALKGYPDALQKKEKIVVPKVELTEDSAQRLNRKLTQVREQDMITVVYFCRGEYLKITGKVAKLDADSRYIKIVNTKIPLDDILEVEGYEV